MNLRNYILFFSVFANLFVVLGCQKAESQQGNSVTIIVDSSMDIPTEKTVHVSGDFESWSGGKEEFKLFKLEDKYAITLDETQAKIEFKFTLGDWNILSARKKTEARKRKSLGPYPLRSMTL